MNLVLNPSCILCYAPMFIFLVVRVGGGGGHPKKKEDDTSIGIYSCSTNGNLLVHMIGESTVVARLVKWQLIGYFPSSMGCMKSEVQNQRIDSPWCNKE